MLAIAVHDLCDSAPTDVLIESICRFDTPVARRARGAMSYVFDPTRATVEVRGLRFDVVLNSARYVYVTETLREKAVTDAAARDADPQRSITSAKRTLVGHVAPPSAATCPLDDLERNPLLIARMVLRATTYGLVANNGPWGQNHCMLVSTTPDPQQTTTEGALATLNVVRQLGPAYEAIFSGVLGGASVFHFHGQLHKGAAAIWRNDANSAFAVLLASSRVSASPLVG